MIHTDGRPTIANARTRRSIFGPWYRALVACASPEAAAARRALSMETLCGPVCTEDRYAELREQADAALAEWQRVAP
jgi:hypothetical protein